MEAKLSIRGMHCKSCSTILTDVLSEIKGIENAHVDFKTGIAVFRYANASLLDSAKAEIRKLGYEVA